MFCNRCGHRNPPGSSFCSSCGAVLEPSTTTAEETTAILPTVDDRPEAEEPGHAGLLLDELPAGLGILVIQRGPNAGSRFLLDRDVTTIGRHPDAEILLDDITVSRKHAEVAKSGDAYRVVDSGSLNGTYLNRVRVDGADLHNGDELQVGKYRLVFYTGTGERSSS